MHLINLLGHIVHRKVTHVWTTLQPKAADLFKYMGTFVENMLSKINGVQKQQNLRLFRDGWEKPLYGGISGEGYRQKHETQVVSKKFYWRKKRVFRTLATYRPWKKNFFPELNRCIFQISLKYIKLVIPKILFIFLNPPSLPPTSKDF